MKKAILFILLIFCSTGIKCSSFRPHDKFDMETIDCGEIIKGGDGFRTFTFENTGDAPLGIQGARSSCGFTILQNREHLLLPGEKKEKSQLGMIPIALGYSEKPSP